MAKLSLEEKVDLLLKYQKNARRWALIGIIIKLVLFFVLVVLPIIWTVNFMRDFVQSEAFLKAQAGLEQMGEASKGLSGLLEQLGN